MNKLPRVNNISAPKLHETRRTLNVKRAWRASERWVSTPSYTGRLLPQHTDCRDHRPLRQTHCHPDHRVLAGLGTWNKHTQTPHVWRCGVVVAPLVWINEVNLRWARLVLGWVTVSGFDSRRRHFISICNQPPRSTRPSTLRETVKWVPAKGRWCSVAGE